MIASLRQFHTWPVMAMSDGTVDGADVIRRWEQPGWGARWAKLHMDEVVPWDRYLYLDADTRVRGDLSAGFDILADGWDVALCLSQHQQSQWLWQASDEERQHTYEQPGMLLSLQGGVLYARKNERTQAFFQAWRAEWQRFAHIDQAALLRALWEYPVKVWLLGRDYNGGKLVDHRFGRAVR